MCSWGDVCLSCIILRLVLYIFLLSGDCKIITPNQNGGMDIQIRTQLKMEYIKKVNEVALDTVL